MYDRKPLMLDIETSGSTPNSVLLSIGLLTEDELEWYGDIRHTELMVTPEAMRVNQIPITLLDNMGRLTLVDADRQIVEWMGKRFAKFIPVGMNVGAFDMWYVRKYLPLTAKELHHQSVDLNALIYLWSLRQGANFHDMKHKLQGLAAEWARSKVPGLNQHHAIFDCYMNLWIWRDLRIGSWDTHPALNKPSGQGG